MGDFCLSVEITVWQKFLQVMVRGSPTVVFQCS
jgi:hypothetical protein